MNERRRHAGSRSLPESERRLCKGVGSVAVWLPCRRTPSSRREELDYLRLPPPPCCRGVLFNLQQPHRQTEPVTCLFNRGVPTLYRRLGYVSKAAGTSASWGRKNKPCFVRLTLFTVSFEWNHFDSTQIQRLSSALGKQGAALGCLLL